MLWKQLVSLLHQTECQRFQLRSYQSKDHRTDSACPGKAFTESDDVMIEAFMDGIELANGCYKTKDKSVVFPITEVVSKNEFFDYNAKYNGEVTEITPARLSPELTERVQKLTSAVYDILGCKGIVRVDYIITEGEKINMLEINTTPGMTATSFIPQQVRAAGIDIKEVMTDIIEDSFQK